MAKNNFSLGFEGFFDLARQIDELGEGYLQRAVENAFEASKNYVNDEVEKAMNTSKYNFDKGQGYSQGRAKKSLHQVEQMPVEWTGTVAKAYIGVDLKDALEVQFLMYGSPNTPVKDKKLYNAVKVKGKVKKEVERMQKEEFMKVIEEGLNNG